ncbi:J domain-containing protein [Pseudomonas promysalinigenes]
MKIRTHYDNLKVSRDAPPEVIRAAYKSLTQKYHPDRNPDPQAAKIMLLLNEAYEVLSDPEKRDNHDKWIRTEEWKAAHRVDPKKEQPQPQPQASDHLNPRREAKPEKPAPTNKKMPRWLFLLLSIILIPANCIAFTLKHIKYVVFIVITGIGINLVNTHYPSQPRREYQLSPEQNNKALEYVDRETKATAVARAEAEKVTLARPKAPPLCSPEMIKAPNGQAWPARAAYVGPITRANGYSTITIDNTKGNSNIYIKLARPTDGKSSGIREAYIPAGSIFKMNKIEPGSYVIKYKDIKNGCNSKSDPFEVEQIQTAQGVQYSDISLTIYTILNGNMDFERLPENAF